MKVCKVKVSGRNNGVMFKVLSKMSVCSEGWSSKPVYTHR